MFKIEGLYDFTDISFELLKSVHLVSFFDALISKITCTKWFSSSKCHQHHPEFHLNSFLCWHMHQSHFLWIIVNCYHNLHTFILLFSGGGGGLKHGLEKATPWKGIHLKSRLQKTTFVEERQGLWSADEEINHKGRLREEWKLIVGPTLKVVFKARCYFVLWWFFIIHPVKTTLNRIFKDEITLS